MQAFTERLTTVATIKGPKVLQTNLVTLLLDEAHQWYTHELSVHQKWSYNTAPTIEPWCTALKTRFQPGRSELLAKLKHMEYTKANLSTTSAVGFVQDVLAVTNQLGFSKADGMQHAYDAFHAILRLNLPRPTSSSDISSFMQAVCDA